MIFLQYHRQKCHDIRLVCTSEYVLHMPIRRDPFGMINCFHPPKPLCHMQPKPKLLLHMFLCECLFWYTYFIRVYRRNKYQIGFRSRHLLASSKNIFVFLFQPYICFYGLLVGGFGYAKKRIRIFLPYSEMESIRLFLLLSCTVV